MYYVRLNDGKISTVFEAPSPEFLETFSEETRETIAKSFEESIKDAISFESLPEDFDWANISRYSIDENHNIIDNGWEEPPREQTTEELLLEMAGDHEYRLCLMELGVTEDDLQAL